jgi:IS30 family transposase
MTDIGLFLGRNKSSVSRELKRNGNRDGSYHPWRGTSLYKYRRKASVRKPRLYDPKLLAYVCERLGEEFRWAPECITERWKMECPGAKLSHNTLYRAIKRGVLKKSFRRRYICGGAGSLRNGVTRRLSSPTIRYTSGPNVSKTASGSEIRRGDTVYGGAGENGGALTLADRTSKFLYATKTGSRDSGAILEAFKRVIGDTPVNSTTLDNGSEFVRHREISARHNTIVYFADPHSPW